MINVNELNEATKQELFKTVSGSRRPHAVLIDGGSEAQREEIAYLLAKIYICENVNNNEPCNNCSSCRKVDERIHPDIIKVTKPSDKKFFVKDDVKKVVEDSYITPNESKLRVFILSEMQLMKVESQNVLLKILEEPPVYTAFILTSQNANSVIGTVLSRVSRLKLSEEASDVEFDEKTIETTRKIVNALTSNYEFDIISATAALEGNKQLTVNTLNALALFFRDALVIKKGGSALIKELENEAESISFSFPAEKILEKFESVNEILGLTQGYPNYSLLIAQLCAKLR